MDRPRAWFLNFDADDELARPTGYTPRPAVAARARDLAARVVGLVPPGDWLLPEDGRAALKGPSPALSRAPDMPRPLGRAFCPTPRALRALARAGAEPPPAPPLEVLRRVNHRRFCAALGQPLPGAAFVDDLAALEAVIGEQAPGGNWVLKRPFGFAGRERRLVPRLVPGGALAAGDRAWIVASLAAGEGLQVEPWVERRGDFCVHGHVARPAGGAAGAARAGAIALGAPCVQHCDDRGAWIETRRADDAALDPGERLRLTEAALEAGEALSTAGYFGPFGVDAFRWEDARGGLHFNARCEINARYTMGWAVGMGNLRPDLGPPVTPA